MLCPIKPTNCTYWESHNKNSSITKIKKLLKTKLMLKYMKIASPDTEQTMVVGLQTIDIDILMIDERWIANKNGWKAGYRLWKSTNNGGGGNELVDEAGKDNLKRKRREIKEDIFKLI